MIFKQWVSVIDERTTDNCLDADGQVQPVDRPFDCLYGSFDEPPAHSGCRAQVVEWLEDMPTGPTGDNPGAANPTYPDEIPPPAVPLPDAPRVIPLPRFEVVAAPVLAGLSPARRLLVAQRVDSAQGDFGALPVWLQRAIIAAELALAERQARDARRRRSYALPVSAGASRRGEN